MKSEAQQYTKFVTFGGDKRKINAIYLTYIKVFETFYLRRVNEGYWKICLESIMINFYRNINLNGVCC